MLQSINLPAIARSLLDGGMTTKELGEAIGLSQPAAWRLASGKTRDVSSSVALKLIALAGGSVQMPEGDAADAASAAKASAPAAGAEEVRDAA